MNFYCLRSFEQGACLEKRFVYSGFLFQDLREPEKQNLRSKMEKKKVNGR